MDAKGVLFVSDSYYCCLFSINIGMLIGLLGVDNEGHLIAC